ncbi:MAG: serine/threonine dehydratase [Pseudomonadota bacterium]
MASISFKDIQTAQENIADIVYKTPITSSTLLNDWLGHDVFFKLECFQKTGSFKLRGATNFLRSHYRQHGSYPASILANSSGNHAQAVAYIGGKHNLPVKIFASKSISPIKAAATKHYGASLNLFENRLLADDAVQKEFEDSRDAVWIPPFNHPCVIAGQGTAATEGLTELDDIDALMIPCGGGGLAASTVIATRRLSSKAQVIAAEPLAANDAAQSLRKGKIVTLDKTPETLADGAATPAVGEYTFPLLQQLDDLIEVDETMIVYWTQWLQHLLKVHIEPTCAMTMHAVTTWLGKQKSKKRVLVIITGGNISAKNMQKIWQQDHLNNIPSLN